MANPDLRRAFAVGEAKRVWKLYGFQSPADLVLEDLAMAMGVVVLEAKLDSADARLVRKGNRGIIRLKQDIPQVGRKRFAVAHEIGHWRLHEKESQVVACTSEDMRADYKGSELEIEANVFASELLMPQALFKPAMAGRTPTADTINGLAGVYRTSRTATAVRYVELSDEHCVMVMAEAGRIKWWRASKELNGSLWIKAGAPVSNRTLAGKYFAGTLDCEEVQDVSMSEWAERYPEFAEDAIEAAIPLGQTGAVLSMIWLE